MDIIWSRLASKDLEAAVKFIAADNHKAAERFVTLIMERIRALSKTPNIGRPGRVPGTRELVVDGTSYIIPYRVIDDTLQIVRVYHSSRTWPPKPA